VVDWEPPAMPSPDHPSPDSSPCRPTDYRPTRESIPDHTEAGLSQQPERERRERLFGALLQGFARAVDQQQRAEQLDRAWGERRWAMWQRALPYYRWKAPPYPQPPKGEPFRPREPGHPPGRSGTDRP
jgi:hypothetical protein